MIKVPFWAALKKKGKKCEEERSETKGGKVMANVKESLPSVLWVKFFFLFDNIHYQPNLSLATVLPRAGCNSEERL